MRSRPTAFVAALLVCVAALSTRPARGQSTPTFTPSQKVEVREGDVWSPATVLAQEGRRIRIKYDDGTEEWVPPARLRAAGTSDSAKPTSAVTPPPAAPPATAPAANTDADTPKPAPAERLPSGGRVEVKNASKWTPATIHARDGDLFLVELDGWKNKMFWKWVPSDYVRAVGSKKDVDHWGEGEGLRGGDVAAAKQRAKDKLPGWRAELRGEPNDHSIPYDQPITAVNLDGVQDLLPQPPEGAWAYAIDKPATAGPAPAARAIVLPGEPKFSTRLSLVTAGNQAVVVNYREGDEASVRVQAVDLGRGTGSPPKDFDRASVPIAVSPDGKRLLGRANGFSAARRRGSICTRPKRASRGTS